MVESAPQDKLCVHIFNCIYGKFYCELFLVADGLLDENSCMNSFALEWYALPMFGLPFAQRNTLFWNIWWSFHCLSAILRKPIYGTFDCLLAKLPFWGGSWCMIFHEVALQRLWLLLIKKWLIIYLNVSSSCFIFMLIFLISHESFDFIAIPI